MIPIYVPWVGTNQQKYVEECLANNWLSWRGKFVSLLEEALARYLGMKHCVLVNSGTAAVTLALAVAGVDNHSEVIVPSLTYIGSIAPIYYLGATPVLIGSNENVQLNVDEIEKSITPATKALVVPELYGDAADLIKIREVCDRHQITMVEDAAESFGCNLNGKLLGSFGDIAAFSFFGNKIITGGELGCVVTNNSDWADCARHLSNHAHISNFHHNQIGFNFRPTNIAAAICLSQLENIDQIIELKQGIANYYREHLPTSVGRIIPQISSSEWMPLFTLPEPIVYNDFRVQMHTAGVDVRPCFKPFHLMNINNRHYVNHVNLTSSNYSMKFNLPSFPTLTSKQLDDVVNAVSNIVKGS